MFTFDLNDVGRFAARVSRLTIFSRPNDPVLLRAVKELLASWERRIEEGNRGSILAGTDRYGHPAPPLSYRPKGEVRKLTLAQRLGQTPRKVMRGKAHTTNLTTAEYRHLAGPFLAPRGPFSRSISNTETGQVHSPDEPLVWYAKMSWVDVASPKGYHFLLVFFDGLPIGKNGPVKMYDLRGIRPSDVVKMKADLQAWSKLLIRGHFGE